MIKKDFKNFSLVLDSRSGRRAWGHIGILLKDGHEVKRSKIRYYNRTWEVFTYQSMGCSVINEYINNLFDWTKREIKYKYNKKRVTKKEVFEELEKNQDYKDLIEFKRLFSNRII